MGMTLQNFAAHGIGWSPWRECRRCHSSFSVHLVGYITVVWCYHEHLWWTIWIWYTMSVYGICWCMMMSYDISWCVMMYSHVLLFVWCITTYSDVLFHYVLRCIVCLCKKKHIYTYYARCVPFLLYKDTVSYEWLDL